MKNLEKALTKAQNEYESLLNVVWWNLSEDEQFIHGEKLDKALRAVEEAKRRLVATKEVRRTAKAIKEKGGLC